MWQNYRQYVWPWYLITGLLCKILQILNVDLNHIENKVTEILKHDRSMTLLQGELISKYDFLLTEYKMIYVPSIFGSHQC